MAILEAIVLGDTSEDSVDSLVDFLEVLTVNEYIEVEDPYSFNIVFYDNSNKIIKIANTSGMTITCKPVDNLEIYQDSFIAIHSYKKVEYSKYHLNCTIY